jgi:hypothetical protein
MAVFETVISPFPPGSARKRDYSWPDPNINMTGAISPLARDRTGGTNTTSGATSTGAAGTLNIGVVGGVPVLRMVNGGLLNQGPAIALSPIGIQRLPLETGHLFFDGTQDDYYVTEVSLIMRMAAITVGLLGDNGLQVQNTNNASGGMIVNVTNGWTFLFPPNTGDVALFTRQNGGAGVTTTTTLRTAASGFDVTQFHKYAFRIIPANATTPGTLKTLIDDVVLDQRSWTGGTTLPTPNNVGGFPNVGWLSSIQCQSQAQEIDVPLAGGFRSQLAPSELALT